MRARQIVSGLGWSVLSSLANAGAQFVFIAVLARLLEPHDFGLMAMAVISLRFVSCFAELGFAQALIQKPTLERGDAATALAMSLALGGGLCASVALLAPLAALYFHAPGLGPVLAALGLSLVLATVAGLPLSLLRREARFGRVAAVESIAFIAGYGGVGIACALAGAGVWSLVAATLSQQLLMAGLAFASARVDLARPTRRAAQHFWRFGSRYSTIGFLEFLFANIETLVIGRSLGQAQLGLYNRAITLSNLPVEQAVGAVNKVMFPALAAWGHDRPRLADGFLVLLLAVGMVGAALACGLSAAAADVVALLLGPRWAAAAPIVAIVAFAVPPMFMYVVCGVTLDSVAALGPKLRLQAVALLAKASLVAWAAAAGVPAIAAAVVVAELLRLALGLGLVVRVVGVAAPACLLVLGWCAGTGAVVYFAVQAASLLAASAPLAVRLAAEAAFGALAFAAGLATFAAAFPRYEPLRRFASLQGWFDRIVPMASRRQAP